MMLGKIESYIYNSKGDGVLMLSIKDDFRIDYDKLKGKEIDITIKHHRNKRSLTANGYMWALLQRLAETLETSKEEVYIELVRRMGYCTTVTVSTTERAMFERGWHSQGLGYQTEHIGNTATGECELMCYYGSSAYDSKQFSRLLDEVILECREVEIPTDTPDKIAYYKALYEEQYNQKGS